MENKKISITYSQVKSTIFKDDAEYYELMEAVKAHLLTHFDEVSYRDDYYRENQQSFMIELGTKKNRLPHPAKVFNNEYWVAMTQISAIECLAEYRDGKLAEHLAANIDLLHHQMKGVKPRYYAERFPEL